MTATIITEGSGANSWLSLTDANIILGTLYHPLINAEDGTVFQLSASHIPHLITAAQMISDNWWFKGSVSQDDQLLAWPRKGVPKPAKGITMASIEALFPLLSDAERQFAYEIHLWNPNLLSPDTLPEGTPQDIKRAQAYLAAFLAKRISIWDDTKYNAEKVKLGGMEVTAPKNAVAKADIVFRALAALGTFKGSGSVQAGGSR